MLGAIMGDIVGSVYESPSRAPIGFYFTRLDYVVTAACAVASAVFLAQQGSSKQHIAVHVTVAFGYDLTRSQEAIRPAYGPDLSSQAAIAGGIADVARFARYRRARRRK
jgi:hypothetical protein